MRVLLVYPYSPDIYQKVGFTLPPLGLAYIASVLRGKGYDVEIHDMKVTRVEPDFSKYDVIGITADAMRYKEGIRLARIAKEKGAIVIMGGPHPTFLDEDALRTGRVDFVVRGEGEETMLELLEAIKQKTSPHGVYPVRDKSLNGVKGISFLNDGRLHRTPNRRPIDDLDSLPLPARDILPMDFYKTLEMGKRKVTSMITSRGCPYGCTFCASSEFSGYKWRARSYERVVDEIEHIMGSYGFNAIAFLDDNFTLNPERVIAICNEIIKRRIDIYWWCFSRADIILRNEEMIRRMSEAGARYIFIGFESVKQSILDSYKKKMTTSLAEETVSLLRRFGIQTHASFIIGGIDETKAMVNETIRFAKALRPEAVQFSILTPYPGTGLFREVKDRITTYDWDLYDCLHSVITLDHLSKEDLEKLLRKSYRSFYLTPYRIIRGLLSSFRGKGIKLSSILNILRGIG